MVVSDKNAIAVMILADFFITKWLLNKIHDAKCNG